MKPNKIVFLASASPTQSFWKRHGSGEGVRIQLDIPESEIGDAIWLQMMTNKVLRVTVEEVENKEETTEKVENRTWRK